MLIHQLLAMSLADDGITAEDAWAHLSRVPDFRGIQPGEFDRLINWMLRDGALRLASGRLVLGPKAEKRFGRKNFMELFAVFTSPSQLHGAAPQQGSPSARLNQEFVDRLVDGVSCFLLGGRAWVVLRVQHDDRRVIVDPAPRGKQPTWGGYLPQFLGLEVCQKIREILLVVHSLPLSRRAARLRSSRRNAEAIQPLLPVRPRRHRGEGWRDPLVDLRWRQDQRHPALRPGGRGRRLEDHPRQLPGQGQGRGHHTRALP